MGIWLSCALAIFAVVVLAVVGLSRIDRLSAHGGGFQLSRMETAGPYVLKLGTIPDPPVVGEAILIVEVSNPQTGERVSNADVAITSEGPGGAGTPYGPLEVWPDSYDPTLYESRIDLDIDGPWSFGISVSGPAGTGVAVFTYEVKRVSPIGGIITLLVLLAFLTVLGLSMRAFMKQGFRGRRVRRRAS